jgi:GAF domain-containing protein
MATTAERFQLLHELSRRLATFADLDELVRYATRAVRDIFAAEGSAILLLDANGREFRFPVSSMTESRHAVGDVLRELRFPANEGIAGRVLADGEPIAVNDVRQDPKFYPGVDRHTGLTTHAILAAPLRTERGSIGVIEVINPTSGAFTPDDAKFLDVVASDVAVAYEKADLHAELRKEVVSLRQLARLVAACLIVGGVLAMGGAALTQLAYALPVGGLLGRPAFVGGVLLFVAGLALLRAARRRARS